MNAARVLTKGIVGILSLLVLPMAVGFSKEKAPSLSVTADSIPNGLALRFTPASSILKSIDQYLVLRTTSPFESSAVSTDSAVWVEYYHDWYKDYFYPQDLRKTFYYQVQAYDIQKRRLAISEPPWYPWTVYEVPEPGVMLAPTAYRKVPLYDSPGGVVGRLLPVNFDITTIYFIGRIYGHNELEELTNTRNVLFTRIGTWFLQMDGKVILERESRLFPQLAVGAEGAVLLRDGKAPGISNPSFAFNFQKENSRKFTGLYAVTSKQMRQTQVSIGGIVGSSPAKLVYLTEFLPSASQPDKAIFGGLEWRVTPKFSLESEVIYALGTPENPWLLNFKMGTAAHTNFDVGYLHYRRGYEVLAHISFRYTLYPQGGKRKT